MNCEIFQEQLCWDGQAPALGLASVAAGLPRALEGGKRSHFAAC